jgi:hypothetical protein
VCNICTPSNDLKPQHSALHPPPSPNTPSFTLPLPPRIVLPPYTQRLLIVSHTRWHARQRRLTPKISGAGSYCTCIRRHRSEFNIHLLIVVSLCILMCCAVHQKMQPDLNTKFLLYHRSCKYHIHTEIYK